MRLPVGPHELALAVGAAVEGSVTRAPLELRLVLAAAGAVRALVQLEPQVGVDGVSRDQRARLALAIDAGVDRLVRSYAQAQVLQGGFKHLVVQSVAMSTNSLVHLDVLGCLTMLCHSSMKDWICLNFLTLTSTICRYTVRGRFHVLATFFEQSMLHDSTTKGMPGTRWMDSPWGSTTALLAMLHP